MPLIFYNNNLINITSIAPGIPSIPTIIEVTIFSPIWNPKYPPIIFIISIIKPPIIEFSMNFKIVFIGTIKTLPTINKKNKHATKAIILLNSK